MKVENIVNGKGNTIANQFIITDSDRVVFQSYTSKIAEYNWNTGILKLCGDMWDYSNTTRKYFKVFINEHCNYKIPQYENKRQWLKVISESDNIKVV